MSVDGKMSAMLRLLFRVCSRAGITIVVAAGNKGVDPGNYIFKTPCTVDDTICVGATNSQYFQADFSNYGPDLDLYAPGEQVLVYNYNGIAVLEDGTSFSAPYVSGIVATYYGWEGRNMNSQRVRTLLLGPGNPEMNELRVTPGSPNILANIGFRKSPPYVNAGPHVLESYNDTCQVTLEMIDDQYSIQGVDFNEDQLGPWGSKLLDKLRHCGVVTDWQLGFYDDDHNSAYTWWSSGMLPIGTKSCIGSALTDLGGYSADGCTGAG